MTDNKSNQQTKPKDDRPLTFKLAGWYGFIFAGIFIIYGGVKVVLSFLDHNYDDLAEPIIFLLIGLGLLIPAFGYKELKSWGYWGLIGINGVVLILAAIGYNQYENIVLLVLSAAALATLFAPATKQYLFKGR